MDFLNFHSMLWFSRWCNFMMKIIKVWHCLSAIRGLIRWVFKLNNLWFISELWVLIGHKIGALLKTLSSAWQIIISHRENLLILIHHLLIKSGHGWKLEYVCLWNAYMVWFHSFIRIIHKRHLCFYLPRKKLAMKQWFGNNLLKLIDTEKFRSMVRK